MNLENFSFNIEYLIVILGGVILYLLYYVFTKDAQYSRNIRSVASVVEDLNRELYYLKKKLDQTQSSIEDNSQRMNDDEIYQEIERSVYDMVHPLSLAIKQLQSNINTIEHDMETKILQLESGVKQISIPASIHGNDDEKIISLFQQGVSIETISKELHLSKPEVEFVLKINKIK
ncbi:hypothetical protein [Sulfurimonas autotrophica]|uniref:Periplasmic protein n=1 Tax=Sulfurimonas autotrophica (strain ATCC BAA-671 / DSM 16294 / JCM 11897 / OK10) TaxID=563040 RepID=E0UUK2_SULAO|nr:hypothetical protein [Sulfurimonas autotrophica]ADN08438.1 conserved hypothetical protein [Sulfurimonas autotrophica DSM 16294]